MDAPPEFVEALKSRDPAKVRALLRKEPGLARSTLPGMGSALMFALYLRSAPLVEALRAAGAEPGLHEAAAMGDLAQVQALVGGQREGLAAYSADGWTPAHLAAHFDRGEVLEWLLGQGAAVAPVGKNAMANTPLHAAAAGGGAKATAVLLRHGAPVDARDAGAYTPLHTAAGNGFSTIVEALLKSGADVAARSKDGKTPLAMALERDEESCAAVLRRHGGT